MSRCSSTHWLISTQVDPVTKVALAGARPSTKTDAAYLLDQAYADAGKKGGQVFHGSGRVWGAVLYKDFGKLKAEDPRRAAAIVAYYKEWLPPWRVPAPAASSSRPTRKRSRS